MDRKGLRVQQCAEEVRARTHASERLTRTRASSGMFCPTDELT